MPQSADVVLEEIGYLGQDHCGRFPSVKIRRNRIKGPKQPIKEKQNEHRRQNAESSADIEVFKRNLTGFGMFLQQ